MNMKRRVFHLYLKATDTHKYYGSLQALFQDKTNPDLGISKATLDRYDFSRAYDNPSITIRKGFVYSAGDIRSEKASLSE